MQIDAYTKSVLTVIATCLLWLSVQTFIHPHAVNAQNGQRVIISAIELDGILKTSSLTVRVENDPIRVNVHNEPIKVTVVR